MKVLLTVDELEAQRWKEKQRFHLKIGNQVIDTHTHIRLLKAVFNNFAGRWNGPAKDFAGGSMNYEEYLKFHSKRLGVKLKGVLSLVDTLNDTVIESVEI